MSDIKLLPCPFCDSENLKTGSKPCFVGEDIYIQCNTCGVKLQICEEYGWEELYKRWNTRKPMERIVERLKEKKKEYLEGFRVHQENELYGVACGFGDSIKICKEEGGIECS